MRRLTVYIIGILVLFGSLYPVSASIMADEGAAMPHCSLCTEEDQTAGRCDPEETESDQQTTIGLPVDGDCDCNLSQAGSSESTGVLLSNVQTSKGKVFIGLVSQDDGQVDYKKKFVRSNLINAPPVSYLLALSTVKQLK